MSLAWAIPDEILENKDFDMTSKILVSILYRLGALEKPIFPRHQWLAKKIGVNERTIRRSLRSLQDKGIVKFEGRRWKVATYSLTGQNVLLSLDTLSGQSPDNVSYHNKEYKVKKTTKENYAPKPGAREAHIDPKVLAEVYWGSNARPVQTRRGNTAALVAGAWPLKYLEDKNPEVKFFEREDMLKAFSSAV